MLGAIICEYNPLHNGHIFHLEQTRKLANADAIVCIMSGDIVQRGEIAIADKYTRAEWAIKHGADIVVEIPPKYCLGSAEIYASGAVKIANAIHGDLSICFGSENGNLDTLSRIANILSSENNDFKTALKAQLALGKNYAASLCHALVQTTSNADDGECLSQPNNILGIEYLKAIGKYAPRIQPLTIKRIGDYKDSSTDATFPSASAIRQALKKGEKSSVATALPTDILDDISLQNCDEKLLAIIKYSLTSKQAMQGIIGIKEGLDNRILSAVTKCDNLDSFYASIATKRYPLPTIKRAIINCLLSNKTTPAQILSQDIDYINVLALRRSRKELLSVFDKPVITKPCELTKLALFDEISAKTHKLFCACAYEYDEYMRII